MRDPERFLIVRTSALGDVVHALPVLVALRRHFPASKIAWVIERRFAPLLAGHPDVDEIVPIDLRDWRRHPLAGANRRASKDAVRRLRAFRPDVALDLMGNHKAGALAWLSGAPRRIGLARADRREPSSSFWLNETLPASGPHAVERGFGLLAALGIDARATAIDFAPERLLPSVTSSIDGAASTERQVLLHPGAAWANKLYPATSWGEVARRLRDAASDLRVVVSAGPGEESLAATVVAASRGAAEIAPAATLADLTRRIRASALVLGSDTGPLHLAHALGARVLMLHGPTDPHRHGPWNAIDRALWLQLPCSFCHRRFDEPKACLASLAPEIVARRALATLDH